jgi:hypothetical protein
MRTGRDVAVDPGESDGTTEGLLSSPDDEFSPIHSTYYHY